MSQRDKETFEEYVHRWRELAAQISPPLEEKEITKIFLKTLSSFYYECMIASAPNDFIETVNMGMRLEEGVREGRFSIEEASANNKYRSGETNSVIMERQRNPYVKKSSRSYQQHHQVSFVIPLFANNFSVQSPRSHPPMPEPLSWWYKPDQHYAYHHGALGHDIENCFPLKYEVQRVVRSEIMSFEDRVLNVKANPLPVHGNSSVNMVDGCPGEYKIYDVQRIRRSLVELHKTLCQISECKHDHDGCIICSVNPRGCMIVKRDIQRLMDEGMIHINQARNPDDDMNVIIPVFKTPERVVIQYDSSKRSNKSVSLVVIWLVGPVPYIYDKVMPYKYDATMIKDGKEVPLPTTTSIVSIIDVVKVTQSDRVFSMVFRKAVENVVVGKKAEVVVPLLDPINTPIC
ncbi:uncharacterized protein LOC127122665 [Lathyrus oleraceus]|uniref:uncharacterized protein LOC127122665 n=1 Tax=Pisum sativum TaxID=3888 RepID=UPI0021D26713|nr:uncharacterized protein LOC127122665 [Pisum sativum]